MCRDPIMEEVQNSTFSLKIMVSAGTICAFHMGGNVDEIVTDAVTPEVPHWEYFIGDRCVCRGMLGRSVWEQRERGYAELHQGVGKDNACVGHCQTLLRHPDLQAVLQRQDMLRRQAV